VSLARGAWRLVASRGLGRIAVAVAIVAAYIALHWAITAIEVLHEQNRFREAPAFAADMVGAVDEEWLVFRTSGVIPEPEGSSLFSVGYSA
jgi:hypothetical protein